MPEQSNKSPASPYAPKAVPPTVVPLVAALRKKGYIVFPRAFFEDFPVWKEKREYSLAEAFFDIVVEARFGTDPEDVLLGGVLLKCKQGECLKSLPTWSTRWHVSRSKARRYLKRLENLSLVDLINEKKTTRVRVRQYAELYQRFSINDSTCSPSAQVPLPGILNTPEFSEIWAIYKLACAEAGHPMTPTREAENLVNVSTQCDGKLAAAIGLVKKALTNGWYWISAEGPGRSQPGKKQPYTNQRKPPRYESKKV